MISQEIIAAAARIQELEQKIEQEKITIIKLLGIDTSEVDTNGLIEQQFGQQPKKTYYKSRQGKNIHELDNFIINTLKAEGPISPIELKMRLDQKIQGKRRSGLHMIIKKLATEKGGKLYLRKAYQD